MKKLTREEADNIPRKPPGRSSYVRNILINMKVGEFVLIEPKDWGWKSKRPSALTNYIEKNSSMKFKCEQALDKSGWIVERLE